MRTTNGAGKPGNRWGGHTGVWVQALSRAVTRLELDDFIRDLTLHRGLMLPKVSGGARHVSK